jgi:hypothetical protein
MQDKCAVFMRSCAMQEHLRQPVCDTTCAAVSRQDRCHPEATQTARGSTAPCNQKHQVQATVACLPPYASRKPIVPIHRRKELLNDRAARWRTGRDAHSTDHTPICPGPGHIGRRSLSAYRLRPSPHKCASPRPGQASRYTCSRTATSRSSVVASKPCATAIRRPFPNSTHSPPRLTPVKGNGAPLLTNSTGRIRLAAAGVSGRRRLQ